MFCGFISLCKTEKRTNRSNSNEVKHLWRYHLEWYPLKSGDAFLCNYSSKCHVLMILLGEKKL